MSVHRQDGQDETPTFKGVYMAGKPTNSRWNVRCKNGVISSLSEPIGTSEETGQFLSPSLCHPHIHLDKCFLLSHPKYADLEIRKGGFAEAMELTTTAKSRFEVDDLMERGRALIAESIGFGVTHMRAFVEVDQGVGLKCLEAGLRLKDEFKDRCFVQICVFAQDPIFSYEDKGQVMKALLEKAVGREGVDAFGSTPYVEKKLDTQEQNISYAINLAKYHNLHLDFHIDYNLDPKQESAVLVTIDHLRKCGWPSDADSPDFRTIVFGHCTRLTLFDEDEWLNLSKKAQGLPISFVGLPTSDLFMMGRPREGSGGGDRPRGTLQIPQMIEKYGLNAAMGINNVGNAFTPYGSCDPLALASFGVGIYQAGTKKDAEVLLQCVSVRAKVAIGAGTFKNELRVGESGDFVVFGKAVAATGSSSFRSRRTTQDLINDPPHERTTVFRGNIVSHR
ncbi:Cytosine deaminase [Lachnellula occidentalis]|uniref:Cytosine deaminase n=1 Tax=Lachnellula occidentalis TaxID=215460 RepID=A0A8H8RN86_9HELO|nr:Cytosine deaminase [Lachnellula occidentalis]